MTVEWQAADITDAPCAMVDVVERGRVYQEQKSGQYFAVVYLENDGIRILGRGLSKVAACALVELALEKVTE